jgi:tetratricopeptide (TPR) repeat protein
MTEHAPNREADDAVHALLAEAQALAATNPTAALALLERQPQPARGLYHHARGALCLRVGRVDDAVLALEEAVRLLPDVADIRANLGAALLARARPQAPGGAPRRADVDRAVVELERAVAGHPLFADAGASLVLALELVGRRDDAIAAADANLARFPDDAATLFNKASALKAAGRVDEARATLQGLVARQPQHPAARAAEAALARLG